MRITVIATNEKDLLNEHVCPQLKRTLTYLSRAYKFALPAHLYLLQYRKPSRIYCIKCELGCPQGMKKVACCYGRAGSGKKYDLFISMNVTACLRDGALKAVIAHEAAHIAEKLLTGRFSHSRYHERILVTAERELFRARCDLPHFDVSNKNLHPRR